MLCSFATVERSRIGCTQQRDAYNETALCACQSVAAPAASAATAISACPAFLPRSSVTAAVSHKMIALPVAGTITHSSAPFAVFCLLLPKLLVLQRRFLAQ